MQRTEYQKLAKELEANMRAILRRTSESFRPLKAQAAFERDLIAYHERLEALYAAD